MKRSIRIEANFTSPGPNVKLMTHKKKRLKEKIRKVVYDTLWEAGMPQYQKAKITYVRRGKMMDKDNLYLSAKVWIDRLVHYNLIPDDNPKIIELDCQHEIGSPATIILIYEL